LPLGELVQRPVDVFTQVDASRIELQVRRHIAAFLAVVDRVVERIVAVGAVEYPLHMDIPRAGQRRLAGQIQATGGDALR